MSKTQQEVLIYKEKAFATAQKLFEKDLKKRQAEGWKLVSITPTKQLFGRTAQLTAIYERESISVDYTLPVDGYPASPYEETKLIQNDPYSSPQMPPLSTDIPSYISNPYELVPPPPPAQPLPYNKTIFFGFILATIISFIAIGISESFQSSYLFSGIGAGMFMGTLISLIIIDTKGFFTLDGLLKWRQMSNNKRIGMGCLFYFLFPIFFFIYLVRAGTKVSQTKEPMFSKQWDAPTPIKNRAKIGIATGVIIVLISIFASLTSPVTTSADSTSTDATSTTTQTAIRNVSTSTPTPTSTPKRTPTPKPKPSPKVITYAQFDDGTYLVGKDIQPGTYRTQVASPGCYYARLKGFSGALDDIIANANTDAPTVITISATDKGFQSSNCGTWTKDLSAITTSKTSFEDGIYIVGTDIRPGTYKSSGQSGCYYARLSGFGGTTDDIIANDNTDTPTIVTILATDKGFQSSNCGTWTKV